MSKLDHPYLLPPSTGTVRYLNKFGHTIEYPSGERWHMVWCDWDRVDGILGRMPQPDAVVHIHAVSLFPSKPGCPYGASYHVSGLGPAAKRTRIKCPNCGRMHD